jgi:hypothetical protein
MPSIRYTLRKRSGVSVVDIVGENGSRFTTQMRLVSWLLRQKAMAWGADLERIVRELQQTGESSVTLNCGQTRQL